SAPLEWSDRCLESASRACTSTVHRRQWHPPFGSPTPKVRQMPRETPRTPRKRLGDGSLRPPLVVLDCELQFSSHGPSNARIALRVCAENKVVTCSGWKSTR